MRLSIHLVGTSKLMAPGYIGPSRQYLARGLGLFIFALLSQSPAMIYQLEIDDQDQTARAVLAFIQQMALTNQAIKAPVALTPLPPADALPRPLGTMRGSFTLATDFTEPLDDLADYM